MRFLCFALLFVSATASATKPQIEPAKPESTQVEQQQSQGQQQEQSASNVAGAVVSSRALSLFNASAIPSQCPPGWVPGRKGKRGWQSPVVGVSAICERDEQAVADIAAARAHELEVLRLQIELAREAQRRIAAEGELVSASGK
jgi:hypothetical protein